MAEQMQIEIENLKCGGCARSILKGLAELPDVKSAAVDLENQLVKFVGTPDSRAVVADKLRSMGYPEKGSLVGLSSGIAAAKSFASCAVGRMS